MVSAFGPAADLPPAKARLGRLIERANVIQEHTAKLAAAGFNTDALDKLLTTTYDRINEEARKWKEENEG